MTTITYLVGKTVDSRQRLLAEKMASSGDISVLHLVPSKGRVMELETDPEFWLMKRTDTLTGFINRIFEENIQQEKYGNRTLIDQSLRSMLVRKVIEKRIKTSDRLLYFDPLILDEDRDMDFPGIYHSISNFFSQLIRNNYEDTFAHDLAGRMEKQEYKIPGSGEERYAMESDLIWLLGDFEELKKEISCYDEDDVFAGVRDFLREGGRPYPLRDINVFILDGFDFFTRIEEEILFYLIPQTDEVWWLIDYDGHAEDPVKDFKSMAGRDMGALYDRADYEIGDEAYRACYSIVALMDRLEKAGIEHRIERGDNVEYSNPPFTPPDPRIGSFPNEIDEVRAIASEIKRIIHEQKLDVLSDLGKIRVIFPELNDYSGLINEVFNEYGLPFSLTRGIPLHSHPISDIFLQILNLPINRFEREDIFKLFSSNIVMMDRTLDSFPMNMEGLESGDALLPGDDPVQVKELIEENDKDDSEGKLDVYLFDRAARRCGINNFGYELAVMEGEALSSVRDYYAIRINKTKDPNEEIELRKEYYGFIRQCRLFKSILNAFRSLANQIDPLEIAKIYTGILNDLGFPGNILCPHASETGMTPLEYRKMRKRDIRAYSLLYDLISASAKELLIVKRLFNVRDGSELLLAFHNLFLGRLNNSYLLDERDPNVIRVSQWLETRGRAFDYIFAGGLTTDRFPLADTRDFILRNIPERILRLPDNVDQSIYLFNHILKNCRKRLYLSYPAYRNEKEIQPSQMILDLKAMKEENGSKSGDESDFKWEDNPFITSPAVLLNANYNKTDKPGEKEDGLYDLSNIILKDRENEETVIRGVRAMASRGATDGLFEYDGIVSDAAEFDNFLRERNSLFSASQMDTLANCPMRYLFSRVYGLKDIDEIGPDAPPLVVGDYIHDILSIFFNELTKKGVNVLAIGLMEAFSRAKDTADKYLSKNSYIDRFEFSEFFKSLFLAGLDQEDTMEKEGIFPVLLRFEERALGQRIPEGIEHGFGFNEEDRVILGKMILRGYIDRFDRDKNDPDRIYLYDYKTGRVDTSGSIKKGLSFQLPVYVRALRSNDNNSRISASFYSLKRDMLIDNPIVTTISDRCDGEGLDISGVRLFDEYADQLCSLIEEGGFHHSVEGLECGYCEFRYACHEDLRRMEHLLKSGSGAGIYSGAKNIEKWGRVDKFRKEWKKVRGYMEKAFSLKTERGRKNNYERVMEFRKELENNRDSLPFDDEYVNDLMDEIDGFKNKFNK
jgi:ATP-dependent helicase/DNAse subunit B